MDKIGSLLFDAATLMFTGMAFVFLFLTLLVYLVILMAKVIPQEQPVAPPIPVKNAKPEQASVEGTNPQVIAAISAAVHKYRSSAKKK